MNRLIMLMVFGLLSGNALAQDRPGNLPTRPPAPRCDKSERLICPNVLNFCYCGSTEAVPLEDTGYGETNEDKGLFTFQGNESPEAEPK